MNFILKNTVFFSILFGLTACEQKRIGNNSFVVIEDGEGNLKSEIHYINDTVMHGLAKYYYYPNPKNVLKDEIEYQNGRKEGWNKHYNKDGKLESKTHWKNDLPDGANYWYYEDGKLKEETFWIKGQQYGSGKWFYKNGQLETFAVTDFYGKCLYLLNYDSLGKKINEEGVVFSPKFVTVHTSDTTQTPILDDGVKAKKEITIKITVAQPPQTKTTIRMGELNKKLIVLPVENSTATYTQTFNETGKHTLVILGEIKDQQGNIKKHDSTTVDLNVIE
ncbi:MAG: hypothetical protein U0Y08_11440 [Bacteroidia bacterium]